MLRTEYRKAQCGGQELERRGPHRAQTGERGSGLPVMRQVRGWVGVRDDGLRQRGVHARRMAGPLGLSSAATIFPGPIHCHYDRVETGEAPAYVTDVAKQADLKPSRPG